MFFDSSAQYNVILGDKNGLLKVRAYVFEKQLTFKQNVNKLINYSSAINMPKCQT